MVARKFFTGNRLRVTVWTARVIKIWCGNCGRVTDRYWLGVERALERREPGSFFGCMWIVNVVDLRAEPLSCLAGCAVSDEEVHLRVEGPSVSRVSWGVGVRGLGTTLRVLLSKASAAPYVSPDERGRTSGTAGRKARFGEGSPVVKVR